MDDTMKTHTLPQMCYHAEFGQRYERTYGDPRGKWAPRVPSFRVTQDHREWQGSIRRLWLPVSDISYRFRDKGRFCSKISILRVFNTYPRWRGCH